MPPSSQVWQTLEGGPASLLWELSQAECYNSATFTSGSLGLQLGGDFGRDVGFEACETHVCPGRSPSSRQVEDENSSPQSCLASGKSGEQCP